MTAPSRSAARRKRSAAPHSGSSSRLLTLTPTAFPPASTAPATNAVSAVPSPRSTGVSLRGSAGGALRGRLPLVVRDLLADLLERPADQPRDVHLRDPDLLSDLALRQPVEEAQVKDSPLALVERAEARREHGAVLGDRVLVLLRPERLEGIELAVLVRAARRQRERRVGAPGLERLEHLLLLDPGGLRQLRDGGRPAELDGLLLDDLRELHVQLLEPARDADGPALVAEVTLDLADDVRGRVRRQLDAAVDVEAVDRLDQADAADLHEVVELLAAVGVAPRERAHEREVLLDQLLARGEVSLLVVAAQQRLVGRACHAPASELART